MRVEIRACSSARDDRRLCHARPGRGDEHGRRVVLIREGRIEQEGSPRISTPGRRRIFAARFIGTPGMNLLALADGPGGAVCAARRTRFPGRGGGLTLGVRPETCLAREFRRRRRTVRAPNTMARTRSDRAGRRGDAVHAGAGSACAGRGHAGAARLEAGSLTCSTRRRNAGGGGAAAGRLAVAAIDVSHGPPGQGHYAVRGKVRASLDKGETTCGRYSQ